MKISIITLFPNMFTGPFGTSMLKKAHDNQLVTINIINLRDFGIGPRKTVDDTPYGGGAGMVLKVEPIEAAISYAKQKNGDGEVILLTPRGQKYGQKLAQNLSSLDHLILICGHYEGVDERTLEFVDQEVSIGDFVLTGGEIPAMVVVDSVVRLIPGVLGDERSSADESFSAGILEYPHYTRPDNFKGSKVPEVLKSGHHSEIAQWRHKQAIEKTKQNRADLLDF